jgi:hypothetical protein
VQCLNSPAVFLAFVEIYEAHPPLRGPKHPMARLRGSRNGGKRPEQDQQGLFWDLKTLVGNALSTVLVLGLRALVLVLGDG